MLGGKILVLDKSRLYLINQDSGGMLRRRKQDNGSPKEKDEDEDKEVHSRDRRRALRRVCRGSRQERSEPASCAGAGAHLLPAQPGAITTPRPSGGDGGVPTLQRTIPGV